MLSGAFPLGSSCENGTASRTARDDRAFLFYGIALRAMPARNIVPIFEPASPTARNLDITTMARKEIIPFRFVFIFLWTTSVRRLLYGFRTLHKNKNPSSCCRETRGIRRIEGFPSSDSIQQENKYHLQPSPTACSLGTFCLYNLSISSNRPHNTRSKLVPLYCQLLKFWIVRILWHNNQQHAINVAIPPED